MKRLRSSQHQQQQEQQQQQEEEEQQQEDKLYSELHEIKFSSVYD